MEFCSGEPDNLVTSVVDYCTGVLNRAYQIHAERKRTKEKKRKREREIGLGL